jgi:hypothetical protein
LLGIRSLIDDGLNLAISFVDGSRPSVDDGSTKAIKSDISKIALVDLDGREAAAMSIRRLERLELARTTVVAVAVTELYSFYVPINLGQCVLPQV